MSARLVLAVALAMVAAGCATTGSRVVLREMEEGSGRVAQPLAKIAVVTIDADAARRKTWDDAFASRLGAKGVQVTTRDGLPGNAPLDAGAVTVDGAAVIDAARRAGADAILFVQPPSETPMSGGRGAYRWLDARSDPDPRTDLDSSPAAVSEVRLFGLGSARETWRAMVLVYYPTRGPADAAIAADAVANGLAKRGFLGAAPR